MTAAQIKAIQTRIGTEPDGFWGPKSVAACQRYLRKLMPEPVPWPKTDQRSLTAFYGDPGDESQLVTFDAPQGLLYEGVQVQRVRCHRKLWQSLARILAALCRDFPDIAAQYAGCYNYRNMRGGSLPSLHARGAAVDFAPGTNGNLTHWPTKATMPLEVMELFAREGWLPAGAFWSRDAMHFQATQ